MIFQYPTQRIDFEIRGAEKIAIGVGGSRILNGIRFGLSRAAHRELDRERIEATYLNLQDRVAFTLQAMGRSPGSPTIRPAAFVGGSH